MVNSEDIIQVLCLIIAVISILGNSLVCHVIIQRKSMKTGINYLLLNLALLDTITGFLGIFNVIIDGRSSFLGTSNLLEQVYNKSAIAGEVLCKVQMSFWMSSGVTPMLLIAMAYERYMAIVHPLTRRIGGVTKARLKWISAICWLSGIVLPLCDILVFTYQEGTCYSVQFEWYNFKVYSTVLASVQFAIPSIVIFVLYYRVIKALRAIKDLGVQGEAVNARNKAKRKVVFIVITVTIIFYIFSGFPQVLYLLYEVFEMRFWVSTGKLSLLLFEINSFSNPLIYFTLMKTFRNILLELICRRRRETLQENVIIINAISIKQHNSTNHSGSNLFDNGLANEPKLLRISASSTL